LGERGGCGAALFLPRSVGRAKVGRKFRGGSAEWHERSAAMEDPDWHAVAHAAEEERDKMADRAVAGGITQPRARRARPK
jgi:hypothetical protein